MTSDRLKEKYRIYRRKGRDLDKKKKHPREEEWEMRDGDGYRMGVRSK